MVVVKTIVLPKKISFFSILGRDSKIHVFRLSDFEGEQNESLVRTKGDVKEHKIERTKGIFYFMFKNVLNEYESLWIYIDNMTAMSFYPPYLYDFSNGYVSAWWINHLHLSRFFPAYLWRISLADLNRCNKTHVTVIVKETSHLDLDHPHLKNI